MWHLFGSKRTAIDPERVEASEHAAAQAEAELQQVRERRPRVDEVSENLRRKAEVNHVAAQLLRSIQWAAQ